MTAPTPPERSPRGQHPPLKMEVAHDIVVGLRRAAAARDVPVARLINNLLDVIVEEPNLVGAILDDGEPSL
jgi:hypothetical protein